MTYKEYIENKQKEFDNLPIKFAFGNKQFKEMMEAWGLKENDTDKIYRLGDTGGFYLKKDANIVNSFFDKPNELESLMNDYDFRVAAFRYEMDNHEYAINWEGDYEVINIFTDKKLHYQEYKIGADYLDEIGHHDWIPSYYEARKAHLKHAKNR